MEIPLVGAAGPMAGPEKTSGQNKGEPGFGALLKQAVTAVDSQKQEADQLVEGLVSGRHANIQETMIALQKASISFKLLTKVQNKIIGAYQEIQRMQL